VKRIYLIFLPILYSCANIQPPTGGPQDNTPPKLESSAPADRTLNFKGKEIILKFNENITANNMQEQLQITPAVESPYKVKIHKKEVSVLFEKDFEPNTTYTLNFRNAIQDITEKNKANNIVISFSTGAYMDSIQLSGNVLDIKTNLPIEKASVELYGEKDTLGIKDHKPIYFTQTDKSGNFDLKNLKNSSYTIFAITDKNNDLKYQEGEKIGWVKNVTLNKNTEGIQLLLFSKDSKAPNITGTTAMDTKLEIRFNEGVILQKVINQKDSAQTIYYSQKENGKTVYLYNTFNTFDSIPLFISVKDSAGNLLEQKMNLAFDKKVKNKEGLSVRYDPADRKLDPGIISIKLIFNKPIAAFNKKTLILDADTSKLSMTDSNYTWNKSRTELIVNRKIKKADTISLYSFKETFISADNDSLSEQKISFTFSKEEDYGIISGKAVTKESNYIIELADANNKLVRKSSNSATIKFTNLKPGEYSLRAIIDSNKNGLWDNGDPEKNIEPEKIIYYKEKIKLKANWEIENISFRF
jgi:uncharacterized protein (DUF2141 family)